MTKPRVLVVGSGGVGTIVALGIHSNGLSDVSLIVRSQHEEISTKGFQIQSKWLGDFDGWKPDHVFKTVGDAFDKFNGFDFIVVTTKNIPDGDNRVEDILTPFLPQIESSNAAILLVQNGIGIEGPLIKSFPNNLILSAISHIGSTRHGRLVHQKKKDLLFVGDFESPLAKTFPDSEKRIQLLVDLLTAKDGLNSVTYDKDVRKTRWEKILYNAVFNPITTLANMDANRIQIAVDNDELVRPAMYEIVAIAASEGVTLDPASVEKFVHIGDGIFYSPSMCVDAKRDQLIELEIMLGNPLRIARANGVQTPVLSVVYLLIKMIQFRIKEKNGLVEVNEKEYVGLNSDDYPKIFENSRK